MVAKMHIRKTMKRALIWLTVILAFTVLIFGGLKKVIEFYQDQLKITLVQNVSKDTEFTNRGLLLCLQTYMSPILKKKNICANVKYSITQTNSRDPRGIVVSCTSRNKDSVAILKELINETFKTCMQQNKTLKLETKTELANIKGSTISVPSVGLFWFALALSGVIVSTIYFIIFPNLKILLSIIKNANSHKDA